MTKRQADRNRTAGLELNSNTGQIDVSPKRFASTAYMQVANGASILFHKMTVADTFVGLKPKPHRKRRRQQRGGGSSMWLMLWHTKPTVSC